MTSISQSSGRLAGRCAVVTGGGSGIGAATAHRLAAEGAAVAVLDARADAAEDVAAAVNVESAVGDDAPGRAVAVPCDVGDAASIAQAVDAAAAEMGGIDAVAACAGIGRAGATHEMSLGDWELVLRVNLTGVFLTVRATVPHLLAAGGGSIVTVGSVASLVAAGPTSSYDASKGGVLQFTRAVAVEYADQGIRANCLCPGVVATGLARNSTALHGPPAGTRMGVAADMPVPITRRADPSEMASVVAFLLSDDASFVTGAALPADGGYTAV